MNRIVKFSVALFVLLVAAQLATKSASANTLSAPTVIEIDHYTNRTFSRPLITGLTPGNTQVIVYIDREYAGLAHVNTAGTATDNFYFQPVNSLTAGFHTIEVRAQVKGGKLTSEMSGLYCFRLDYAALPGDSGAPLPTPTLVSPSVLTSTGDINPFITGLSFNNTQVHVYIDGAYDGKTNWLNHHSGVASFAYTPKRLLTKGKHEVWLVAEDKKGKKSGRSVSGFFEVEAPMPAPTLFTPVVGQAGVTKPIIRGLAKNDSHVKVFVDNRFDGEFDVMNHQSGTASFAYIVKGDLTKGQHVVYTTAIDKNGKASGQSNWQYYTVLGANETPVADEVKVIEVEEEGKGAEVKTPEVKEDNQATTSSEQVGSVDEDKDEQGKIRWNLIIFIFFLVSIIAWIFWVNRELIKERKIQETKDEEDDEEIGS